MAGKHELDPMIVTLKPGQSVHVNFFEADGGFEVHFDTRRHPMCILVKEVAGLDGNQCGNANAILYEERFEIPSDTDVYDVPR
jgi:hypothetical protein